jgi:hypothetical protein
MGRKGSIHENVLPTKSSRVEPKMDDYFQFSSGQLPAKQVWKREAVPLARILQGMRQRAWASQLPSECSRPVEQPSLHPVMTAEEHPPTEGRPLSRANCREVCRGPSHSEILLEDEYRKELAEKRLRDDHGEDRLWMNLRDGKED